MAIRRPLPALPQPFAAWFAARGWRPYPHQLAMVASASGRGSTLLIAPTGGGKTLAGFLPSLVALAAAPQPGLHTLYVSPLRALAVDVHRNLEVPIAEMSLPLRAETRTGDTPVGRRLRQRRRPPHLLLTTPESLALLLSYPDAEAVFAGLDTVIVDELHALAGTKRGDLLALGLARLASLRPALRRVGLSATVADEGALAAFLGGSDVAIVRAAGAPEPEIGIAIGAARMPWSGHMATFAVPEVYALIRAAKTAIVFVNTRAQAEIVFQTLWRLNDDRLAIALHHGSLSPAQRRKVEAAMADGKLRAVVATSSLDLGIDWGAVDLVIQVGAPKGVTRLLQRVGRANHRLDEPSRAVLVPANRFEVLECRAALDAAAAGELDGAPPRPGGLDVLAQHILCLACAGAVAPAALFAEVARAAPYRALDRATFDAVFEFVATGGYALAAYERYRRLVRADDGSYRIASAIHARRYRMNVGTIVEAVMIRVRRRNGRMLGQVEEWFVQGLVPGDTFIFAGELLQFEGMHENDVIVTRGRKGAEAKVPVYGGGRLPLTTHLAAGVRAILADERRWRDLPAEVLDWLAAQKARSVLPGTDDLLVETFPRAGKEFLVAYCFEGRNAHQTLGMLLTRRMERAGLRPLGFVATDYVLAVWSLRAVEDVAALFAAEMLGDDLEEWMDESSMLRRTFRNVAVIAGLIERRAPGHEKTGRQVTVNSDLIYDVLRRHEPHHVLLRATRADAATGLTDIGRIAAMLARVRTRIRHRRLARVSPLAVPVILEVGREQVYGEAIDDLLDETSAAIVAEAFAPEPAPQPERQRRRVRA